MEKKWALAFLCITYCFPHVSRFEFALLVCSRLNRFCCCYLVPKSYMTLADPMDCSTKGFPVPPHHPEFAQVHVHWVGDAICPSHPLSSPSPPALSLSQQQGLFQMSWLFASGGRSIGFSMSPSSECSGLISFRSGWFNLLAVQGTLKSLLQHHNL